ELEALETFVADLAEQPEDRRLPDAACFRKLRQGVVQYLLRIFIDIVIYLQFRSGEVLLRLFQPDRRLHFILPNIQTNPSVPCSIVDCVPEFLRNQLRTCDRAADDDCM